MFIDKDGRRRLKEAEGALTIGLELGLSILVGLAGGRWLDAKFDTTWIQWVGLAFGLAAGGRSLYRLVRQTQRDLANKGYPSEL